MTAIEIQLSSAKYLLPDIERKRVEWDKLIEAMNEKYEFNRPKLSQKSPLSSIKIGDAISNIWRTSEAWS